jgi:hypothetical protein
MFALEQATAAQTWSRGIAKDGIIFSISTIKLANT